jgi:hypothetical protein
MTNRAAIGDVTILRRNHDVFTTGGILGNVPELAIVQRAHKAKRPRWRELGRCTRRVMHRSRSRQGRLLKTDQLFDLLDTVGIEGGQDYGHENQRSHRKQNHNGPMRTGTALRRKLDNDVLDIPAKLLRVTNNDRMYLLEFIHDHDKKKKKSREREREGRKRRK